jgi:hypothetical protein
MPAATNDRTIAALDHVALDVARRSFMRHNVHVTGDQGEDAAQRRDALGRPCRLAG